MTTPTHDALAPERIAGLQKEAEAHLAATRTHPRSLQYMAVHPATILALLAERERLMAALRRISLMVDAEKMREVATIALPRHPGNATTGVDQDAEGPNERF